MIVLGQNFISDKHCFQFRFWPQNWILSIQGHSKIPCIEKFWAIKRSFFIWFSSFTPFWKVKTKPTKVLKFIWLKTQWGILKKMIGVVPPKPAKTKKIKNLKKPVKSHFKSILLLWFFEILTHLETTTTFCFLNTQPQTQHPKLEKNS